MFSFNLVHIRLHISSAVAKMLNCVVACQFVEYMGTPLLFQTWFKRINLISILSKYNK